MQANAETLAEIKEDKILDPNQFCIDYFSKMLREINLQQIDQEYFSFITTFSNLMLIVSKNASYLENVKQFIN
jgi:hypothetical protein